MLPFCGSFRWPQFVIRHPSAMRAHTHYSAVTVACTVVVAGWTGQLPSARPSVLDASISMPLATIGHHPCLAFVAGTRDCRLGQGDSPLIVSGAQPTVDDSPPATVVTAFLVPSTLCLRLLPAPPPTPKLRPQNCFCTVTSFRPLPPSTASISNLPPPSPVSRITLHAFAFAVAAIPFTAHTHHRLARIRANEFATSTALRC